MGGNSEVWTYALRPNSTSMAFQFAEMGFDVWLANNSGTKYSLEHDVYTVEDEEFWQIDWRINGIYDTPALVNEI